MHAFFHLCAELSLAVLSPPRCAACDEPVPLRQVFCAPCGDTLEWSTNHGAAFVYGGALARAITLFKYNTRPDLARPLSSLLIRKIRGFQGSFDLVVPVPLHPERLATRGFNQAALLARPIARSCGAAFFPRLLIRTRPTPRQAELSRAERKANVADAFAIRPQHRMSALTKGTRLLLVDDVRTTGSTLASCVRVLENAGFEAETLVLAEVLDKI